MSASHIVVELARVKDYDKGWIYRLGLVGKGGSGELGILSNNSLVLLRK